MGTRSSSCRASDPAGCREPGGRVHLLRCLRAHAGGQRRRSGLSGLRTSAVALAGPGYPRAHRGDRAERADRARWVRDDRALPLRPFTRVEADTRAAHRETGLRFTYEVTEPGLTSVVQGYELSMAIVVRIIRLLAGQEARPSAISFTHDQQGSDAAYRETLGCPVRFGQTWCGFELSRELADRRIESADPETRRIATKYLESNYLPPTASLSERVAELTRRLLPTGQCTVDAIADQLAMHPRSLQRRLVNRGRAMSGPDRPGTSRPGGDIPRRAGVASQPDRGPARLCRTEHP